MIIADRKLIIWFTALLRYETTWQVLVLFESRKLWGSTAQFFNAVKLVFYNRSCWMIKAESIHRTMNRILSSWTHWHSLQVTKKNMIMMCRCHGTTGTCVWKTCWRELVSFRQIGHILKEKYDAAIKVKVENNQPYSKPSLVSANR